MPFEVFLKAPGQMASVVHTPNGDSVTVYNGSQGWVASPNNPVMLLPMAAGAESDGARLDAQLFFLAGIKQAREFPLREKIRMELRAEAFNVTNSVRLGAPNSTLSGTFGQITGDQPTTGAGSGISAGSGGRILQFAMKVVF